MHPCSSSISLGGQVGSALGLVGGGPLQAVISSHHGSLKTGEATITGAGNLPCDYVIHVHGPSWNETDSLPLLNTSVKSCLKLASNKNIKSIAFPSISSGGNNFPKQTAAQCILQSIRAFFESSSVSSVKTVTFVLFDQESIDVYTTELARMDV